MKAIAINAFKDAPGFLEIPDPQPGEGEVVVDVQFASVNGMDLMTWLGYVEGMMPYEFPITLGRDFSGTVAALGTGVEGYAVGDAVFGMYMAMPIHVGAFAPQIRIPVSSIAKRPAGVDAQTAGALSLAGGAAKLAVDAAAPKNEETALVSGATGGVGAIAMQLLKAKGVHVIATATPDQAEFVQNYGADEIVDFTGDIAGAVRAKHPQGVDILLHFAGDGAALSKLLKAGGRAASLLGLGFQPLEREDVTAIPVMTIPSPELLQALGAAVASGKLRVPITKTYPLAEAGQAMADFSGGALGKLSIAVR
jgi:NADPH:quinone reductase-like Zn-dependent oxidoreductase